MSPAALEGQTLGKYRILEPLGHGGMARVYRAYHPQLDRYVAVKVLRSDLLEEEEFLVRFQREARAVAGLRQANIVQVFDFDTQGDLYYMVMELLEGDTLKARLADYRARGAAMTLGEVTRVILDALEGLGYAHSEHIIHRDLKPGNIMLTRRGQAVLTDFGIAQIVGGTHYTASGALMGTLHYMAPEQGLKGQCDARSDIYSIGIVLYEMLTGRTPFDADTPLAILLKHVNDPLPLPRAVSPDIPEAYERVLLKALSKQPEDRYQSAAEMAQAVRAAAQAAEVEIPDRISLPNVFTTPAAPAEPVAVFSGAARDQLAGADFDKDDTAATLGTTVPPATPAARAEEPGGRPTRGKLVASILSAVGVLVVPNITAGILAGAGLNLYARGWPLELILVGLGLAIVMEATGVAWLLIPLLLLLGNGVLFFFYTLTGWWNLWLFLWPLEPVWIGLIGLWTIGAIRDRAHAHQFARRLIVLTTALALGIVLAATLLTLPAAWALGFTLLGVCSVPVYLYVIRPWQLRWGATDEEVQRTMPGDKIVSAPTFNATRAVTVNAPPEAIWPWLVQIGHKRAGWYSYDLIDNLGLPSARRILPEFQDLKPGDLIPASPDGQQGFWVKALKPQQWLLWDDRKNTLTWCWGLYPLDAKRTRLITRVRLRYDWFSPAIFFNLLLDVGDIVMMRKCLLGIKQRAEKLGGSETVEAETYTVGIKIQK